MTLRSQLNSTRWSLASNHAAIRDAQTDLVYNLTKAKDICIKIIEDEQLLGGRWILKQTVDMTWSLESTNDHQEIRDLLKIKDDYFVQGLSHDYLAQLTFDGNVVSLKLETTEAANFIRRHGIELDLTEMKEACHTLQTQWEEANKLYLEMLEVFNDNEV